MTSHQFHRWKLVTTFSNGRARDIRIKPFSMELNRQDCGDRGEIISFLRRRSSKNRHGCVWRLSPEGHVEFLRRSEPLEGIYGRFPSVDPVAVRARVPYLGKIHDREETVGT